MVGLSDDAGVLRLSADVALVQSVDYFTPIVDDASDWGRIAAANALSDLYAMGATPLTALHVVGWPRGVLPFELLSEVMTGSAKVLAEAGCTLVGGHSIDDPEPKFGLAVTGTVHPDHIVTNKGAVAGDLLVLTKPIGTGIASTALKRGFAGEGLTQLATQWMATLNAAARDAMIEAGVSAATDVTGFGLLGHLGEMVQASEVGADLSYGSVPLLPGVADLVEQGFVPGGTTRNLAHADGFTDFVGVDEVARTLLADAQTSGGLLIAAPAPAAAAIVERLGDPAAIIGRARSGAGITVTR
jgi:selenide,water dikinase